MDMNALLANIPDPTMEEMEQRISRAVSYTLVFLRKGPAPRDNEEQNERLQQEHLQYLTKLQMLGKLVLNGPVMAEHEILGISIYDLPLDEATALAQADPKVRSGYLIVEAIPWLAVPARPIG